MSEEYIPLAQWAAQQVPPMSPVRARQIWNRIQGAKQVPIEGSKGGNNGHYIVVPVNAPDPRQKDEAGNPRGGRPVGYHPATKYLKNL